MQILSKWAVWMLIMQALAGCSGLNETTMFIPPVDVAQARKPDRPLTATLLLPPGAGPFPVVILLHGCGGIPASRMVGWTDRLNGWGYAALVLDSFSARGVTTVCAPKLQPLVTARDRAGDVLSAATALRSVPQIDPDRIGVLGLSHGGATAAWVTQRRYQTQFPGLLRASVDYYGPCHSPETQGTVPLLALAGEADTWGYPALSCRAFAAALEPDQPMEVYTYPNTAHAFDDPMSRAMIEEGHPMGYNHAASQDSFLRTRAFLDKYLMPPPDSAQK
jgi:dienelactone hydrolase